MAYIALLIVIGGILELMGVAVFTPFIQIITAPTVIEENKFLSYTYRIMGFRDTNSFIIGIAVFIIVVYVFKNLFLTYEKNSVYLFSYGMQHRVAKRLLKAYLAENYAYHLKTNPAELIRTIQVDTDYFTKAVIHTLELIMEIVVCSALIVYLFIVSPMITIITSISLFIAVSLYVLFSKKWLREVGRQSQKYGAEILECANQALGGVKEIKVLNREEYFIKKFSHSFSLNMRCIRLSRLASVLPKYFVESICIIGLMLAVIIKMKTDSSNISSFIPQLAVFATAAFRLMPSVGRINEHTSAINNCYPSVNLIYEDLRSVESVQEKKEQVAKLGKMELTDSIKVENISFGYDDSEKEIVKKASFMISRGKTVAFVGESGSGKTTLVDIILGLLIPKSGKVEVDGVDINSNMSGWQKNIGYIPQAIYLSDDSIRKNIAFGIEEDEIDDKAVEEAARKAQLLDFVSSLPEGFETVVGERGARISGGQKQRIGIARALYHNPEVLVLDEATSALDNETEKAVMEAIDGLHGTKTIIIIAHRLSTIQNADLVYEVGEGKVTRREKSEVLGK